MVKLKLKSRRMESSFCLCLALLLAPKVAMADWDSWWTYEGISGPDFWGRLNPKWSHCSKGRRQSPIDIDTELLVYDPSLPDVEIKGDYIDGLLVNTGRSINLQVNFHQANQMSQPAEGIAGGDHQGQPHSPILIHGGPLSYHYTLSNITLHFGRENDRGSEHTINQQPFAGELQFYGYNGQLYANWSEAKRSPNGLVAIAVMVKMTKNQTTNSQLKILVQTLKNISNRGDTQKLQPLYLPELLPDTRQYVTYDGSLTQPACFETVQWIVLNRPVYITGHHLHQLRTSFKQDGHQDNFRPIQPANRRSIRTNIVNHRNLADMRLKYEFDHSESASSSHFWSRELCYVNQPIGYKSHYSKRTSQL